ncbi:hypothetical protein [Clostridium chrysemydis]|uniref:hypothetical protein n=1 Tax=Clostridium chrysemydis TaxID=2665504 RepID=UPI001883921A|nr:hypothetical protein [Clostridium chrysemydis]
MSERRETVNMRSERKRFNMKKQSFDDIIFYTQLKDAYKKSGKNYTFEKHSEMKKCNCYQNDYKQIFETVFIFYGGIMVSCLIALFSNIFDNKEYTGNEFLIAFSVVIVVLIVILYFFYRNKIKDKDEEIDIAALKVCVLEELEKEEFLESLKQINKSNS